MTSCTDLARRHVVDEIATFCHCSNSDNLVLLERLVRGLMAEVLVRRRGITCTLYIKKVTLCSQELEALYKQYYDV